jgi:hypothetical protein
MALSATPYGLRPLKIAGNRPQPSAMSQYPISNAYNVTIYNGDPVKLVSGYIQKVTGSNIGTSENYIGVFGGCVYTNPTTKQPLPTQYWASGTAATDALAYVYDDPNQLFQVQLDTSNVNMLAQIGQNISLNSVSGSAITGDSNISASNGSIGTASALSWKICGVVNDPYNGGVGNIAGLATTGVYPDIIVRVNFGFHAYERALAVNS